MSPALVLSARARRRVLDVLTVLGTASLTVAGCAAFAYWFVYVRRDVGQVQSRTLFQLWSAVVPLSEWADANGGRYPESIGAAAPALAKSQLEPEDPWDRPFQYELITPHGSQARIFTLGKDGKPGGTGADEDIVYWMSGSGVAMTWDVNVEPLEWYEPGTCGFVGSQ